MAVSQSSSFPADVGVKQICVIAPNILNRLRVAITLVSLRDLQSSDRVGIEYHVDCDLFNLRRLQAKSKTYSSVIMPISTTMMQTFQASMLTDFNVVLMSCLKFTCVQAMQSVQRRQEAFVHHLMSQLLPFVGISLRTPKCLPTLAHFSGDHTNEIQRRNALASSAFGSLSKRVIGNQNHTIHTKIAVFSGVVISTVLCGSETCVPCRRHIRLLESIYIRLLHLFLGLRWWHKMTYSEIRSRAGIPSIESMLLHRQLRLLDHVITMPHCRLPHQVFYSQ